MTVAPFYKLLRICSTPSLTNWRVLVSVLTWFDVNSTRDRRIRITIFIVSLERIFLDKLLLVIYLTIKRKFFCSRWLSMVYAISEYDDIAPELIFVIRSFSWLESRLHLTPQVGWQRKLWKTVNFPKLIRIWVAQFPILTAYKNNLTL